MKETTTSSGLFAGRGLANIFGGPEHAPQKDKVREYIIHRIEVGEHLEDIAEEDYVLRNCTQPEVNEILRDPRVVHAARESMEHMFSSGELDPKAKA